MQNNDQQQKNSIVLKEEQVLEFWEKAKIFEKSLEKEAPLGEYTFYDGPPFATGTPHYGHIVGSLIKDAIPRYWTMRGYRVPRLWGWDCHGLPIENIAEKALGVNSKKEIEETIGVEKFNETCRKEVLGYVKVWEQLIPRLGRWADMKNAYKTMDPEFMESVWWVFKSLWDKGLVYEGYRSMHICPRCETTLSQSEVSEGYEMVKDLSVVAKFKLIPEQRIGKNLVTDDYTYILAWTTTPWTLMGNVALAINGNVKYQLIEADKRYIVAVERVKDIFKDKEYNVIEEFKGLDLLSLKYEPIFDYYSKKADLENKENGWKIYDAEFVNTQEGTGVVHIAPAFGNDDMELGKTKHLPFVQHVSMNGKFKDEVADFKGLYVKPLGKEERLGTDIEIIKYLAKVEKLFSKEKFEHSYPHCWRCSTPLLNYATSSWFVSISKIKNRMLELAKDIQWSPTHVKEGRFGNWLEGARDWSISRQRYWGSAMPLWLCECGEKKVIGSRAELEKESGQKISDLHKHVVDKITIKCGECKKGMKRVPDVLDTWFDSGSMPFAQAHYPFENKESFDNNFPAKFIGEGIDQTRCWFYYMHAISTAIKDSSAYENVVVNGMVLAEDGKKMAKKLKNYPDPSGVIDKYGADAMRLYLLSSPIMQADQLCFKEKEVEEVLRNNVMLISNVLKFYFIFDDGLDHYMLHQEKKSDNIIDEWIKARLTELINDVAKGMIKYDLPEATRPIEGFINDLSTWYIRRSRDRFKSTDQADKTNALNTTAYILVELSKVMAPFMPFIAEDIWQRITLNNYKSKEKSVHLENWPILESELSAEGIAIIENMKKLRKVVELGLSARNKAGIKVRQPLNSISARNIELDDEYVGLIRDELNVKEVILKEGEGELGVEIDTKITQELMQEGIKRDLVRLINAMRRDADLSIKDSAVLFFSTESLLIKEVMDWHKESILKDTLSNDMFDYRFKKEAEFIIERELKVGGEIILIGISKK